jgi:hypothetical protein
MPGEAGEGGHAGVGFGGEGVLGEEEVGVVFVGVEAGGDGVEVGGEFPVPDEFGLGEEFIARQEEEGGEGVEIGGGDGGFFHEFFAEVGEEACGGGGELGGVEAVEDAAEEVGAVGVGGGAWGADAEEGAVFVGEEGGVAEGGAEGGGGVVLEPGAVAEDGDEEGFVVGGGEGEGEAVVLFVEVDEAGDRGVEEGLVLGVGLGEVVGPAGVDVGLGVRGEGGVGLPEDIEGVGGEGAIGEEGEVEGGVCGNHGIILSGVRKRRNTNHK